MSFILRFGTWLFETYEIIIILIPTILIISYGTELGAEGIALCGGIMQVGGALYGILIYSDLRQYFSKPTLWKLLKSWVKRCPFLKKDITVMAGNVVGSMSIGSAKALVWSSDDPNLPLEERINRMIRNHNYLRINLDLAEETISKQNLAITGRIEKLESTLSSEISQVNSKLESIHTEDFLWALTGLLYILIGTVFSNFAEYIL
ncbi:MAG: hypothetical protein P8O16_06565 [Algoriphagus sp.]|uniref:hypothetical protein n=1 Tax=Algoriphagus sp. TaxID=1872435 RepID=UPI0026087E93|nr:hypothetical protein [Algoriphagus sp.]MDG1276928.1 hypothetical protein [Algoriphagus sp.]